MRVQENMKASQSTSSFDGILGPALLLAILLAPLAVHAYIGTYSRYIADDYCTAAQTKALGFWGSQAYWYMDWTGRYAYNGVLALLELVGPWVVPALPAAAVLGWMLSLAWTLYAALPRDLVAVFRPSVFLPGILSALAVGLTLTATPDVYQSLYWQTGLVNYTLPLILLTLQAGILLRAARPGPARGVASRRILPILVGLLAGLTAAFSETYLVVQVLAYLAAAAWLRFLRRPDSSGIAREEAAMGLVGTLLSAGVVILAPGNAVRLTLMPERAGILVILLQTLRYGAAFLAKAFLAKPFAYTSAGIFSFWIGARWRAMRDGLEAIRSRDILYRLLYVALACGVLVVALVFPSAYATGAYPVDRALVGAAYASALAVVAAGLLLGFMAGGSARWGQLFAPGWRSIVIVALVAATFSEVAIAEASLLVPDASVYALQWDRRADAIDAARAEDSRTVTLRPLPHIASLPELQNDPKDWVNQCFAQYYGFEAVIAK